MERITKHIGEDKVCYAICEKDCPDGIYADNPACMCTASKQAQRRLMEYEDTELTPEEVQDLKERDTAKAPALKSDGDWNGEPVYDTWICPNCEEEYEVDFDDYDFCPKCGQRILK